VKWTAKSYHLVDQRHSAEVTIYVIWITGNQERDGSPSYCGS